MLNLRRDVVGVVAVLLAGTVSPAEPSPTNVSVTRTNAITIGTFQIFSSSVLIVSWTPSPADQTDHFEIVASESVQGTEVRAAVGRAVTSVALTGLRASTIYAVTVLSCQDAPCRQSSASASVSGATDTEYWQLRGTGNTVDTLTTVVSDGNARLSATRFGPDADSMANRVQLYYGPRPSSSTGKPNPVGPPTLSLTARPTFLSAESTPSRSSLAVAVASAVADALIPESFLTFTSRSGSSGLIDPVSSATLVAAVATGQGVPIAKELGGFVRLFFEARGADGLTRIMSLDSADGYVGLDFNTGAATTCSTAEDYSVGGGCAPTVAFGVEGDVGGNDHVANARQHKVGWPTLESPHWDLAAGTFMVFTIGDVPGCSAFLQNHGYAVWDGAAWVVQYLDDGCPKLFTSVQAAFPFHSGGARYRLYYGDPSITTGKGTSNFPFLGPKKLIYADGAATGLPDVVDFEDWEAQASARDVVFLWPNGEQLDDRAEGYIDDYHLLTPTGDPALQVMYITLTDGAIMPLAVTAMLTNP
jgi:hypothetical protein